MYYKKPQANIQIENAENHLEIIIGNHRQIDKLKSYRHPIEHQENPIRNPIEFLQEFLQKSSRNPLDKYRHAL